MGVRNKGRRKIHIEGVDYVWYIADNADGEGYVLHIISSDKQFIVMYPLWNKTTTFYLVVLGRRFSGAETGKCWQRFECPRFDESNIIYPRNVRALVLWCLDDSIERIPYVRVWPWPL
ncbi:MAG: hypothetical protein KAH22_09475 [Thiotrichaceae bacterium]|nr:hypothetical protein [Thiotrichaceae bacterium]